MRNCSESPSDRLYSAEHIWHLEEFVRSTKNKEIANVYSSIKTAIDGAEYIIQGKQGR